MTLYVLFDIDSWLSIGLSWRGERTSFLWIDFKLRRNALIGLYLRVGLFQWTQISNSEGMCWLDYIWERTYFHGDRFLTFDLCVGFNWRENFLPGHRILTFNLCVGFNWRENFLHDLRILTFDLFVGFNWRENFLADQISNFRFLCRTQIETELSPILVVRTRYLPSRKKISDQVLPPWSKIPNFIWLCCHPDERGPGSWPQMSQPSICVCRPPRSRQKFLPFLFDVRGLSDLCKYFF